MKAVLKSIKPYWLYLFLIGKKSIEIVKNFPTAEDWNKRVYFYCSKDLKSFNRIPQKDQEWMIKYLGKVACEMCCDGIDSYNYNYCTHPEIGMDYDCGDNWWEIAETDLEKACISYEEFKSYAWNRKVVYGWVINWGLKLPEPKEISEFRFAEYKYGRIYLPPRTIKRPPQSWCYVEEVSK